MKIQNFSHRKVDWIINEALHEKVYLTQYFCLTWRSLEVNVPVKLCQISSKHHSSRIPSSIPVGTCQCSHPLRCAILNFFFFVNSQLESQRIWTVWRQLSILLSYTRKYSASWSSCTSVKYTECIETWRFFSKEKRTHFIKSLLLYFVEMLTPARFKKPMPWHSKVNLLSLHGTSTLSPGERKN